MPPPVTIEHVENRVKGWLASGDGPVWVVAVSGGSDSVGLLRVLHALSARVELRLTVAHLDHGARGEAGRADAAFVEELARSLDLPFDLGQWAPTRSGHFEADARRARYAWLLETARARGASAVAVGHTRDDQAETTLHRVIRGTGVRGLAGMRARRALGKGVVLVRPLLIVARNKVRKYLDSLQQPFRDDPSNPDLSRTRARIRHDLLPKLAAEYNPQVVEALARLGTLARWVNTGFEFRIRGIERNATVWSNEDSVGLDRQLLKRVDACLRTEVVRMAWRRAGWPEGAMDARRWRRIAALVRGPVGRSSVGAGIEAEVREDLIVLKRPAEVEAATTLARAEPRTLEIPGAVECDAGRVVAVIDPEAARNETIDLDGLAPPLWVRAPLPGDRFEPLGMDGRSTPLNDFFRGRHLAREARERTPLVCDKLGIVWVVGHRIAHRVRLTEGTKRRGGLRWEPG